MQFWVIQTLNSLSFGGLLFLLAAGFSLIFGLMRIANLTHGALFMLGAYIGAVHAVLAAQPITKTDA
jgi:branched-chain amino acid transport system permease protein